MAASTGHPQLEHQQEPTRTRFADISLVLEDGIEFEESVNIKDCCSLPDGKMIFADFNNSRLLVYNPDDMSCTPISTGNGPYGLTVINSTTVAVSCSIDQMVQTINITPAGIVKATIINTEYCCHGLSYNRGNLYVLVQFIGVEVYNVDGNKIRTITLDVPTANGYLCCCSDGFCYTGSSNIAYYHVNENNRWISTMGNCGVTVDNTGHIFVTNSNNSALIVMSASAEASRRLLSGLDGPKGVFYNKENNKLLVVTRTGRKAVLYRVDWCTS